MGRVALHNAYHNNSKDMKTGVLLINLGTPNSPRVKDVRNYLREFLSDPYVIDIPAIFRWLLLHLFILPRRPQKSAQAYRSIWTEQGSPLLFNSQALADNTQQLLGESYQVALGMRYGIPSMTDAVEKLRDCDRLIVLPLFPQYSLAATQTAIDKAKSLAKKYWRNENINVIRAFYDAPSYVNAQAQLILTSLGKRSIEQLLFSYHGLPQRQVKKTCNAINACQMHRACPSIEQANQNCYRAQCFATSKAIAKILQLHNRQYMTTFQSRLPGTQWLRPYADKTIVRIAAKGVKNIAIVCPSFVVDCLETLEEIGIRARTRWQQLGGENLYLIPCLNDNATWLANIIIASAK